MIGLRIIFLTVFVISLPSIFAQEDTDPKKVIIRSMYIEPKADKYNRFEKGLADHMEKHHPIDGWQVNVWTVETGKRAGQYLYVSKPHTWEDFDTRIMSPGDDTNWEKYVTPYTENIGPIVIWRVLPDLSIFAKKEITKLGADHYYLHPGGHRDFLEFLGKIKPALEDTGFPYSYGVAIKESGGYIPVILITSFLGSWKDMEPFSTDIYEAMTNKYGEEEAKAMFDKVYKTIKWIDNEILTSRPELSSGAEKNIKTRY